MAARRLIIVLVLLLAASIVAAMIAPDRTRNLIGETDSTSTTTTETTSPDPGVPETPAGKIGDDLEADIAASAKKPETVVGFVGDQLTLTVSSDPPRSISIPALGLTDFAAPNSPAQFFLLLQQPGTYPILDGDNPDEILGKLIVKTPQAPSGSGGESDGKQGKGDGNDGNDKESKKPEPSPAQTTPT